MSALQHASRFPQNGCAAPTWPPWRGGNEENIQRVQRAPAIVPNSPTAALSALVTVSIQNSPAGGCEEKFKKSVQDLTSELSF